MQKQPFHIILICLAALLLSSCSIRRLVPKNEQFLYKNKIVIKDTPVEFTKSEVKSYITQEPFKTEIPYKWGLWFYYKTKNSQGKFGRWINKYLGRTPEYYDNDAAVNSARQIEQYLNNRGYFNSKVTLETKRKNRWKRYLAKAIYTIQPAEPYRIKKINYQIEDTVLAPHLMRIESRFPAKVNDIYNAYTLDEQRTVITDYLRNAGYYYFN